MVCRSEEEFEKFQQMDIERRRQEASLGSERKPRLIEESELPPFLIQVQLPFDYPGSKLLETSGYVLLILR